VRFLGTRLAAWLSMKIVWKVDPYLMRWALADCVFSPYAAYRERAAQAGRTIPILGLTPP
jgi:hypothetical protein